MVEFCIKIYGCAGILAPWAFLIAKLLGVYNFDNDSLVFGVLLIISGITLFMVFKPHDKKAV